MERRQFTNLGGEEGAALALLGRRAAGVPHEVVGDQHPATPECIQQGHRTPVAGKRRGAIDGDHRQSPARRRDRVAFPRMGLLPEPQCVERRLEGGPIDDLRGFRSVCVEVCHCCLHESDHCRQLADPGDDGQRAMRAPDQGRRTAPRRPVIRFIQGAAWNALISRYIRVMPSIDDACDAVEQSTSAAGEVADSHAITAKVGAAARTRTSAALDAVVLRPAGCQFRHLQDGVCIAGCSSIRWFSAGEVMIVEASRFG